jgi:hypothetical protein
MDAAIQAVRQLQQLTKEAPIPKKVIQSARLFPYRHLIGQLPPQVSRPTLFIIQGPRPTILRVLPGDTKCCLFNPNSAGTTTGISYSPSKCLTSLNLEVSQDQVIRLEGDPQSLIRLAQLLSLPRHPSLNLAVETAIFELAQFANTQTPKQFDPFNL